VRNSVTVRQEASSNSAVVGSLGAGETATLLGEEGPWFKVQLSDGTEGFVSKSWTKLSEPAGKPATEGSPAITPGVPGWDTYGGLPQATKSSSKFEVFHNEDFTVGYSETREDPVWVAYHLFRVDNSQRDPRPSFRADLRTQARVQPNCYSKSGFDRGHNAPNYAIDTRYGPDAQRETFLMSNISPQAPCLNEETWEAFEKVEANDYANSFGNTWTITGPIFESTPQTIDCGVQVPSAFYKIVVEEEHGTPAALAVVMSQDVRGKQPLRTLVTTVKHVEELTGLDFFPQLSADIKAALETAEPDARWGLDRTLTPSRVCRLGP